MRNRAFFSVMKILATKGFSNDTLRDVLHFFIEENVPLAYNLAWYDSITDSAERIEKEFSNGKITIAITQKVV